MSKRKKYIRIYANGDKIQSTGSHSDDRKHVINMWMLDNPEKNIKDILFGQLAGKKYSSQHQVVIEIEVMGYYDGEKEGKDTIYLPYRLINTSPFLINNGLMSSPNFKFEPYELLFDNAIYVDAFHNWVIITDNKEFSEKLSFPNIYLPRNVFVSDRDIPLVSWVNGVITCENCCKHYSLFYITKDNKVVKLTDLFDDANDIEICDHSWEPRSLVEFALRHNLNIGYESYKAICMQYADYCWETESGGFYISEGHLPTLNDLSRVLVYDYGVRTRCQYPSWAYEYESNPSWSLFRR